MWKERRGGWGGNRKCVCVVRTKGGDEHFTDATGHSYFLCQNHGFFPVIML